MEFKNNFLPAGKKLFSSHSFEGAGDGTDSAFENDAVEAIDNALDFIVESLYKRKHAPSSCDGFLLCTHNIRDQRRISILFRKRQQTKSELGHIRRRRRCPMQAWGEFGFRQRRIRKSKASLGRMRARRVKHQTSVYANAGNRLVLRSEATSQSSTGGPRSPPPFSNQIRTTSGRMH